MGQWGSSKRFQGWDKPENNDVLIVNSVSKFHERETRLEGFRQFGKIPQEFVESEVLLSRLRGPASGPVGVT